MATYCSEYQLHQSYPTYPVLMTEYPVDSFLHALSPLYTPPVQLVPVILSTQPVVTDICPYTYASAFVTEPVLTSLIPETVVPHVYESMVYPPEVTETEPLPEQSDQVTSNVNEQTDAECYLTLPKELFPPARMFSLDPNPLINEFCKLENINDNTSWILDLEFGVPSAPLTRAIPVYDVQFNSIHCKNTPGAIHPGFERCSDEFKRELILYYDIIISTWYNGYVAMKNDGSVKNFQAWLQKPLQKYGMCWLQRV